jgi:hypothetical protein
MSDRRDEREMHAELELGTPEWLPGGKLSFKFRRLWDKRAADFIESTADAAGVDIPTVSAQVVSSGQLFDLFQQAAHRATERGDEFYHDILSRLVAAALLDDAKIDAIAYVTDRIIRLEPLHVRIVSLFLYETLEEALAANNPTVKRIRGPATGDLCIRGDDHRILVKVDSYASVLGVDESIIESCLNEISEVGFTELRDQWAVSRLGRTASILINDVINNLKQRRDAPS